MVNKRRFNRPDQKMKRKQLRHTLTEAERIFWVAVQNNNMGIRFVRQYSVDAFVIDFYNRKYKLAIEIDGGSHSTDQANAYDKIRQRIIETSGITFIRFTNLEIFTSINQVLLQIEAKLHELRNPLNHP